MALELTGRSKRIFRDLDLDFAVHPNTKTLLRKTGDDAVIRAVLYLLKTNHYDRLFHPEIGSNLTQMLFEPLDRTTARDIQQTILDAIRNHEPRVKMHELVVDPDPDQNAYAVKMKFFILNQSTFRSLDFLLERVR